MGENNIDRNRRKPVTFNIKEDLIKEFAKVCGQKGLIMSRRIEKCIEEDIEKVKRIAT